MFKSDKLGVVKCLTASPLPSMLCQAKRIDLDLITGKTYESIVKTYCIFVNESTQEKALGRQHTPLAPKVSKVSKSQISELCHLMALPCNGYKLNLLTSASMCHMALCSLCWKLHSNFSFYWKNELKQASSTWCFLCYYYLEFILSKFSLQ